MSEKRRHVLVGTSGRSRTFIDALTQRFADNNDLRAFCDISQVRMDTHNRWLQEAGGTPLPTYKADAFDRMLAEEKPDSVIVTCTDRYHHEYIVRALKAGCDVITEKPMTIDAPKCHQILDTVNETGGKVHVTFNYRYMNGCTKVKELLNAGTIGTVRSVNLEYLLDTRHGADYFRRWHSYREECGGLLVHKSTHHFDLVNWWIDSVADQVFSHSALSFYGKENAIARGDEKYTRYPRYTGYPEAKDDPFALLLIDPHQNKGNGLKQLYYDAEEETGYLRDQNVFRDGITSFDNMSVTTRYRSGVILTYSLVAFSPREGMRVCFNGDRGRIEFTELGGSHIIAGQSDEELAKEQNKGFHEETIAVFPHFQAPYTVEIPKAEGGHGGSDPKLQEQLFGPNPPREELGRLAQHEQGAASILIGIAANHSVDENRPVKLTELVNLKPEAIRLSELA